MEGGKLKKEISDGQENEGEGSGGGEVASNGAEMHVVRKKVSEFSPRFSIWKPNSTCSLLCALQDHSTGAQ